MRQFFKTNMLVFILLTVMLVGLLFSCTKINTTSPSDIVIDTSNLTTARFEELIESAVITNLDGETDEFSKTILTNFEVPEGTLIEARYVTIGGAGTKDGSSWENAWEGSDLRDNLESISDAGTSKVYVVLVAGGTYKPTTGSDQTVSFSMKNYVAIVGGFHESGSWEYTGTTIFTGNLGTENDDSDNSYHVFYHDRQTLDHALLYGVKITGGNSSPISSTGGGMYNDASSPRIINVVFSSNSADWGGGMYNLNSSPLIMDTVFSENNVVLRGGGMYNWESSPRVINTVFSDNSADKSGGGMYNWKSVPQINDTVFSGNRAISFGGGMYNSSTSTEIMDTVFSKNSSSESGGGMYNKKSSPQIINTIFSGNSARTSGGGMANYNSSTSIINTVFIDNTAHDSGQAPGGGIFHDGDGQQLSVYNSIFYENATPYATGIANDIGVLTSGTTIEYIQLVGSVLGIFGTDVHATNAIASHGGTAEIDITYISLSNANPGTTFTAIKNGISYTTLSGGAGAQDLGLHLKSTGNSVNGYTYYMSKDGNNWYTAVNSNGNFSGSSTPTASISSAADLTTTDFNGKVRAGRPDAGVIEE